MDRVFEHGGMTFEWDEAKASENLRKHGVSRRPLPLRRIRQALTTHARWARIRRPPDSPDTDLVQPYASHARDFRVDAGVMMSEETYTRPSTCKHDVKTRGLADVSSTAPVTLEANTRRRIVHQYYVYATTYGELLSGSGQIPKSPTCNTQSKRAPRVASNVSTS
jgi:hypothetical protein